MLVICNCKCSDLFRTYFQFYYLFAFFIAVYRNLWHIFNYTCRCHPRWTDLWHSHIKTCLYLWHTWKKVIWWHKTEHVRWAEENASSCDVGICSACKASFVTLRFVLLRAYLQWRKFRKGCRVFSFAALEEVVNTAKLLTYIMLSLFPTNFSWSNAGFLSKSERKGIRKQNHQTC